MEKVLEETKEKSDAAEAALLEAREETRKREEKRKQLEKDLQRAKEEAAAAREVAHKNRRRCR